MESMENLKENLCCEIVNYSRKSNLTMTDVENIHMLSSTLKNLLKIEKLEDDIWNKSDTEDEKHREMYSHGHYGKEDNARKNEARDKLMRLMNGADDEYEREIIRRCVETL